MKVRCLTEERKTVVAALERRMEEEAYYMGAPSFSYTVGPYMVTKHGYLEVDDAEADIELLKELSMKGFIASLDPIEPVRLKFAVSGSDYDGPALRNLVIRIYTKEEFLSKVVGQKGAFKISTRVVKELVEKRPEGKKAFLELFESLEGNKVNEGIEISKDEVVFTGFPLSDDPVVMDSYTKLAAMMAKEAMTKKKIVEVKSKLPDNEKYRFRSYLLSIGMIGDEYKAARKVLLRNLVGNTAYHTKQQADTALEKLYEARRKERELTKFHVI